MRIPVEERFWSKIDKSGGPDACWLWAAGRNIDGYGFFEVRNKLKQCAHRVAWELTNGPIPEGLCVLHHCDVPACCNPSHLFLGTKADNVRDAVSKGRNNCSRGGHNKNARLTEADVLRIREMAQAGASLGELSQRFGVGAPNICLIIYRKRWKHI